MSHTAWNVVRYSGWRRITSLALAVQAPSAQCPGLSPKSAATSALKLVSSSRCLPSRGRLAFLIVLGPWTEMTLPLSSITFATSTASERPSSKPQNELSVVGSRAVVTNLLSPSSLRVNRSCEGRSS
jgi:hypothetical protein